MTNCLISEAATATPIFAVISSEFGGWLTQQPECLRNWVTHTGFTAQPGNYTWLPDAHGKLMGVLLSLESPNHYLAWGQLPKVLPMGIYRIVAPNFSPFQLEQAALGWGMGSYQFRNYRKSPALTAQLVCDRPADLVRVQRALDATFWVRDLINTPAQELYPEALAAIAEKFARNYQLDCRIVRGPELAQEFPAVMAVGQGSEHQPLLLDLHYGDANHPKIALVGKGVCFDSGGLQLKSSEGMLTMKKDMAGGAHVLGLLQMIAAAKLPLNVRAIIPTVENLPSGKALKPGDIIRTRKGITVEVANTDAEGRLILADALTLASEWQPQVILDFATLTGAARIALGPDIIALMANQDQLAQQIQDCLAIEQELIWRLPLHQPYIKLLESEIADFQNIAKADGVGGGTILAGLFLEQFVAPNIAWAHLDMNGYNRITSPGKPAGGEAECLRGIFRYLENYF